MLVENATSPWGKSWERVFQDCPHGEIRDSCSWQFQSANSCEPKKQDFFKSAIRILLMKATDHK